MLLSTNRLGLPAWSDVALFARVTDNPGIKGVILFTVLSGLPLAVFAKKALCSTHGKMPAYTQYSPALNRSLERR